MNKHLHYPVAIFCLALTATAAHAEGPGHCDTKHRAAKHDQTGSRHFKAMDIDGDGLVSKAEYDGNHDKHFKEMDTNSDGKLSPDEMQARYKVIAKERMKKRFEEADADHDGALNRAELKSMPVLTKNFDEFDTNKDGKLTQDELKAGWEKRRGEHGRKEPKTNPA